MVAIYKRPETKNSEDMHLKSMTLDAHPTNGDLSHLVESSMHSWMVGRYIVPVGLWMIMPHLVKRRTDAALDTRTG